MSFNAPTLSSQRNLQAAPMQPMQSSFGFSQPRANSFTPMLGGLNSDPGLGQTQMTSRGAGDPIAPPATAPQPSNLALGGFDSRPGALASWTNPAGTQSYLAPGGDTYSQAPGQSGVWRDDTEAQQLFGNQPTGSAFDAEMAQAHQNELAAQQQSQAMVAARQGQQPQGLAAFGGLFGGLGQSSGQPPLGSSGMSMGTSQSVNLGGSGVSTPAQDAAAAQARASMTNSPLAAGAQAQQQMMGQFGGQAVGAQPNAQMFTNAGVNSMFNGLNAPKPQQTGLGPSPLGGARGVAPYQSLKSF